MSAITDILPSEEYNPEDYMEVDCKKLLRLAAEVCSAFGYDSLDKLVRNRDISTISKLLEENSTIFSVLVSTFVEFEKINKGTDEKLNSMSRLTETPYDPIILLTMAFEKKKSRVISYCLRNYEVTEEIASTFGSCMENLDDITTGYVMKILDDLEDHDDHSTQPRSKFWWKAIKDFSDIYSSFREECPYESESLDENTLYEDYENDTSDSTSEEECIPIPELSDDVKKVLERLANSDIKVPDIFVQK